MIRLLNFIGLVWLVGLAACSPQAYAEADATRARSDVEKAQALHALENQAARDAVLVPTAAAIEAQGMAFAAEQEQKRQEDERQVQHAAAMNAIEAAGVAQVETIKADQSIRVSQAQGQALSNVVTSAGESFGSLVWKVGLALALAAAGFAAVTFVRNRAEALPIDASGQYRLINRGGVIIDPNRMVGPLVAVHRPSLIERLLVYKRTGIMPTPQVFMPLSGPVEAQLQITQHAQDVQMIAASTRPGSSGQTTDAALSRAAPRLCQVFNGANPANGFLPAPQLLEGPEVIKEMEASFHD